MRLDDERESDNVEDRRGGMPLGRTGLGLGGVIVALVVSYVLGIDPRNLLGLLDQAAPAPAPAQSASAPKIEDQNTRFVRKVLATTEDVWTDVFQHSGRHYEAPKLVLFGGSTPTACGLGQAAAGPFYCPGDRKVYIDLEFFQQLRSRFHAPGEFAQAYVVAHEVGHHVQNLLGTSDQIDAARGRASKAQANALSVRLELQADCYAGVWGKRADSMKKVLEPGELEQALNAATAIGDDKLQQQARGVVVPETFTHGSSEQRVRWFSRGFESGDPARCDTFKAAQL